MHVVVLLKQVLDPEIPSTAFRIDAERRAPLVERAPQVLSVFDGNALEAALRLREGRGGDLRITALSLGPRTAEEILRKALALTADAAILIEGDAGSLDSAQKARVLAAAIRRLGTVDLVLSGRQAADWEAGQVGAMVAEALGLPCLPFVSRLSPGEDGIEVRQQLESGVAIFRLGGPAVLTCTNDETNVLRPAKVRDVMAAGRREIARWPLEELGHEAGLAGAPPAVELIDLTLPVALSHAEMLAGGSPAERAEALVRRLEELGAI